MFITVLCTGLCSGGLRPSLCPYHFSGTGGSSPWSHSWLLECKSKPVWPDTRCKKRDWVKPTYTHSPTPLPRNDKAFRLCGTQAYILLMFPWPLVGTELATRTARSDVACWLVYWTWSFISVILLLRGKKLIYVQQGKLIWDYEFLADFKEKHYAVVRTKSQIPYW